MKKLFFFNLNNVHNIGERSMHQYNIDNVEWYRTINSSEVNIHYPLFKFDGYSHYIPIHEIGVPLFNYFIEHKTFDLDAIEKSFAPIPLSINRDLFYRTLKEIDINVEYVKTLNPDIIFLRYYSCFEFYILYFLYKIKDMKCFKSLGGADFGADVEHYIDQLLENEYIDNYHDGYGEEHLSNILANDIILPKTSNFNYVKDTFSIADDHLHWIITTLTCNGKCKFCVHNRPFRSTLSTDINFTSDDYIDFIIERLLYLEKNGVTKVNVPASITFYNKQHLLNFHQKYMSAGLNIKFVDTYFKFDDLNYETIPLLEDMNFHSIKIGLESITQSTRELLGKHFNNDHVYHVTEELNKSSIFFKYSLIYNFPFENYDDLTRNLKFLTDYNIKYAPLNRYELTKDTDIYNHYNEFNLIKKYSSSDLEYFERKNNKLNDALVDVLQRKLFDTLDNNYIEQYYDGHNTR